MISLILRFGYLCATYGSVLQNVLIQLIAATTAATQQKQVQMPVEVTFKENLRWPGFHNPNLSYFRTPKPPA